MARKKKTIRKKETVKPLTKMDIELLEPHGIYPIGQVMNVDISFGLDKIKGKKAIEVKRDKSEEDEVKETLEKENKE